MADTLINRKTLSYLALGIVIAFLVLIYLEVREYYFSSKNIKNKNHTLTHKQHNKERYQDIITNSKNEKYSGIIDYLEKVEDPKLYVNKLGCYDNDQIIEEIKGKGETCKSFAPKVMDIYSKEAPTADSADESAKNNYFLTPDGKVYSFAEICPVTSNQSRPIKCLYDEAEKFHQMGIKLGNIIEDTQDKHDNTLNHLDSNISYHIVDNNRLYNKEHVKDFIGYENYLGMNKDIYRNINDKINDLSLFSKKVKKVLK